MKRSILGLLCLLVAGTQTAFSADSKGEIGATGGIQLPLASGAVVLGQFGITGGMKVADKVTAGGRLLFNTFGGSGASVTSFFLGLQGKYNVVDHLNIGLTFGPIFTITTISVGPVSTTSFSVPWAFGPNVGYDFMINDKISVGAEVDFLFNTGSFSTPSLFFLGNVKYHF